MFGSEFLLRRVAQSQAVDYSIFCTLIVDKIVCKPEISLQVTDFIQHMHSAYLLGISIGESLPISIRQRFLF